VASAPSTPPGSARRKDLIRCALVRVRLGVGVGVGVTVTVGVGVAVAVRLRLRLRVGVRVKGVGWRAIVSGASFAGSLFLTSAWLGLGLGIG